MMFYYRCVDFRRYFARCVCNDESLWQNLALKHMYKQLIINDFSRFAVQFIRQRINGIWTRPEANSREALRRIGDGSTVNLERA